MKKINPKVITLVMLLLTGLVAGGKLINDTIGAPSAAPIDLEDGMD